MSKKHTKKELIHGEPLPKNICDLPNELLEKIICHIPVLNRLSLRKTSRRMRSMCDAVFIHEFNSKIIRYGSEDPDGYEYAALTAIKNATWHYVRNGFESVFCVTMLPLVSDKLPFSADFNHLNEIKYFLKNFFRLVNERIGNSQLATLLFSISLIELLKKLKISSSISPLLGTANYLRIVVEIVGSWFGIVISKKSDGEPDEGSKLLVILCDMMIAKSTNCELGKLWYCDRQHFVYGNVTSKEEHLKNPSIVLSLEVNGPSNIISLLKSCVEDNVMYWPNQLPKEEFDVLIGISCKEALNHGCEDYQQFKIGRISNLKGEDEQEDSKNEYDMTCGTL